MFTASFNVIASAPAKIRALYALREVEGRITWQWPMLSLLAQKPR